jgi:DnaJ-domain-containing protein 1
MTARTLHGAWVRGPAGRSQKLAPRGPPLRQCRPMHLPTRLRSTTLTDLVTLLHEARANGTLELVEDRGRVHRIFFAQGLITAVDLDGAGPSLAEILRRERAADEDVLRRSLLRAISSRRLHGEVLVREFRLSRAVVSAALRRQLLERLAVIDDLGDARLAFRVALRPPHWALGDASLDPREYVKGGGPAREPPSTRPQSRSRETAAGSARPSPSADAPAWRVLGIAPTTDVSEIKRAYRRLARTVHPDLHPRVTDDQRHALEARFVEITEAYRVLVA